MSGFVTMPQVLQVIGQAPNKHGRKTAIENLRAVKSLFPMFGINGKLPPQMQEMMDKVMKDGPGAMLQNPIGAISGALGGQISGLTGQLSGALSGLTGAGGMLSALTGPGGLSGALSNITGVAASLSGLPGGLGNFDINSVMGHAGLAGLTNLPGGMSLDKVLGPVLSQGPLAAVGDTLRQVQSIAQGGGAVDGMIGQVLGHVATINGIVDASNSALTQGLQATLGMSAFSVVADGLDPTNKDNPLLDFFDAIVLPEARAAFDAHHAQLAAEAPLRSGRSADGTIPGYTPPEGLEEP